MGIEPKPFVVLTGDAPDYLPITMAFVSCVSPTFFQPAGSSSLLYPAHRNTVRSGHRAQVLPTLVGLSLWDCLALAFCTLIISHLKWFVKNFFTKSYIFPRRYLARTSSKKMVREPVAYSSHFTRVRPLKRRNIFFVPLLYHNLEDLSRGFFNFFRISAFLRIEPQSCFSNRSWLLLHCTTHRAVCQGVS